MKLLFNLWKMWCCLVDYIMEIERRFVMFSDLVEFVDNEVRVIVNFVFGKIIEDVKFKNEWKDKQNRFGRSKISFVV